MVAGDGGRRPVVAMLVAGDSGRQPVVGVMVTGEDADSDRPHGEVWAFVGEDICLEVSVQVSVSNCESQTKVKPICLKM